MSPTNKILVVVVILAVTFAILFAVTANNSEGPNVPDSPSAKSVAEKKAKVLQMKNTLDNTISAAIGTGVPVNCKTVSDCLKGLPEDPQRSSELDSVINRLQSVIGNLDDKLNSPCLQGLPGARAAYNRLLYQIADKTDSLNIDPAAYPEIFTDNVKMCMTESNLKCTQDYENCLTTLDTTLKLMNKIVPKPSWHSPTPSMHPSMRSPTPSMHPSMRSPTPSMHPSMRSPTPSMHPSMRSPTPSMHPSAPTTIPVPLPIYIPPPKLTENYAKIVDVKDKESLGKYFLLDDPSGIGLDPTGGINNYAYPFIRGDAYDKNPFFQCITQDTSLISDVAGMPGRTQGVRIGIAPDMTWNWADQYPNFSLSAGAPRLMTQKFFKGGLFILDIRHAPIGCAIWPALWLNAFVGEKDQFHLQKEQDGYDISMTKLVDTYISKETYNPVACKKGETLVSNITKSPVPRNEKLSEYAKKDIYVAAWPAGGEIDMFENVSFENKNLISIHGGAMCELVDGNDNDWYHKCLACSDEMKQKKARSTCGISDLNGFGPYSGCNAPVNKMNGEMVTVPGTNSKRYSCLASAGVKKDNTPNYDENDAKDGNTQVIAPDGSFGIGFNDNGGGVYVCEWIPMKKINIWLFPHDVYSMQELSKSGSPLSDNPNPDGWPTTYTTKSKKGKTLIASYLIGEEGTLKDGCNFNFMNLIINIAIGGGFGGNTMPDYCTSTDLESNKAYKELVAENKRALQANEYIRHCYNADPKIQGGGTVGPLGNYKNYLPGLPLPKSPLPTNLKCYDGANQRGPNKDEKGEAYFYKSAYFDIDSIRIFQKKDMDSVF